jgi:anti-anti-sigma factor
MHFQIRNVNDVNIIALSGNFDGGKDCDELQKTVHELADEASRKLVFNFSLVRWVNSCGIGTLIAAKQLMDELGGHIVLCNLDRRPLSVLYKTRLYDYFDVTDSIDEALALLEHTETVPNDS